MNAALPVRPLNELATSIDYGVTASASKIDSGSKFLRITDIQDGTVDWRTVPFCEAAPNKLRSAQLLDGDIVFARTGATTGKSVLIQSPPDGAVFASYLIRVRPSVSVDPAYLAHFFQSKGYWSQIQRKTQGAAQGGVNATSLSEIEIPLLSLDEQRRVATILNKADALRRKRKRALDMLDKLTRSIYLERFGGLDGRKPAVELIGSVCDVGSGSTPRREDASNFGGNIHWVKTTEVKGNVINDTQEKVTEVGANGARLRLYPIGTVLVAMYGQGATRGKVGILGVEATTNQACAALVPGPKLNSVFLFHQLRQSYESLRSLGRGGNQPNLNGELVKSFEILVPPLDEQFRFVEIINSAATQASSLQMSLTKLEAFFSSLQSRAFSGQL